MSTRTILQLFEERVAANGDAFAFGVYGDLAQTRSWREWHTDARCFAAALIESGCTAGDVVAILAGNTALWPVADLGALMAGAISVGIYPTSAAVQVHEILNDCAARVIVVDSEEQLAKVFDVHSALPNLRHVICTARSPSAITWQEWLERGASALPKHAAELNQRVADATPDDVAVLIYTSGSTGAPKGARITHRCITASAYSIRDCLQLADTDTSLSFLPYCHAGERIFGLYTRIAAGMSALHVEHTGELWEASRTFEPTLFGGLPRFYEKIYEALLTRYATLTYAERATWNRALELGRERTLHLRDGCEPPADLELAWRESASLLRETVTGMVGARVRVATSGGATLPTEIAEYLAAAGLIILGAYGLTEHLCAVMHRPDSFRFDSAGLPMMGTTLRIAADGEIQIERSDLTFAGYQNNPAETRAAFTLDGQWLHTGDLGHIDEAGRLHVTGREKDLIALSGGKKVAPAPIEQRLTESPWISQAVLCGENRKFISALLVLRRKHVEEWATARGLYHRFDDLLTHPEVVQMVQREVDAVNRDLSRPEQVKVFALLPAELTAESEELTPTMKVRRTFVERKYRAQLESLYRVHT